jgi:uncharacterized MAPEG superfamily protein
MIPEVTILAWGCLLALVYIFAPSTARTKEYGVDWNMGARDKDMPPPSPVTGRLIRAQANFFETFPIVIAVILALAVSGKASATTELGAQIWLGARILYLPVYALGIKGVRSFIFLASLAGILIMLWPLLLG